jgi:hypothetical protein
LTNSICFMVLHLYQQHFTPLNTGVYVLSYRTISLRMPTTLPQFSLLIKTSPKLPQQNLSVRPSPSPRRSEQALSSADSTAAAWTALSIPDFECGQKNGSSEASDLQECAHSNEYTRLQLTLNASSMLPTHPACRMKSERHPDTPGTLTCFEHVALQKLFTVRAEPVRCKEMVRGSAPSSASQLSEVLKCAHQAADLTSIPQQASHYDVQDFVHKCQ